MRFNWRTFVLSVLSVKTYKTQRNKTVFQNNFSKIRHTQYTDSRNMYNNHHDIILTYDFPRKHLLLSAHFYYSCIEQQLIASVLRLEVPRVCENLKIRRNNYLTVITSRQELPPHNFIQLFYLMRAIINSSHLM